MGLEHRGEGGNYLLVWPTRDVTSVEGSLRARGILVRGMRGKPVIDGSFRVSIGTMGQMQRFVQALEASLSERT
jgi:histidinol-phosphate aminotransferase